MRHPRLMVAALSLSAAGFAALVGHEGFTERPVIPTPGDRPTIGLGSTFREDGSPVSLNDPPITVPRAIKRSLSHIQKDESQLKRCVLMPVSQVEYDLLVDHAYQYGPAATCDSSMVRFINQGNYEMACESYLLWYRSQGRDCRQPEHWGPRGCRGVWERSQWRRNTCLGQ